MVVVMPGGLKVKVNQPGRLPPAGSVRGRVRGFSARSRARLVERMMGLELASLAADGKRARRGRLYWVTLTYAAMVSASQCKADVRAFRERLARALPAFGAVWKVELQKRGVPHFHLLLAVSEVVEWSTLSKLVRSAWSSITGARVVDVRTVYGDAGRLLRYLAKYLGKTWDDSSQAWGRVWGLWWPDRLPWGDSAAVELDRPQLVDFLRLLRRWGRSSSFLSSRSLARGGGLVFGEPGGLVQLLRFLAVEDG